MPPDAAEKSLRTMAWILFLSIASLVAALDLWSKRAVFALLEVRTAGRPPRILADPPPREIEVIPGFFDLQANYNYGAFNGWFSQHTDVLAILSCVAVVVIAAIVWWSLRRSPQPRLWFIAALGLVAGGTAGNLYDRFALAGVRDWIKWYVTWGGKEYVWPNFNIADSGICVGVGILIFLEVVSSRSERRAKEASGSSGSPRRAREPAPQGEPGRGSTRSSPR